MSIILKARGVEKIFHKQERILKNISCDIHGNTFTVFLGPSGSGKTTLLNVLSGLLKPTSGEIWHRDRKVTGLSEPQLADWKRSCTGNIFQNYLLLRNLNVRENIEAGRRPGQDSLPLDELAGILEIGSLLDKFPAQLSGGQQQRTAIARAVVKKPELLFCDEATGALDEANSKKVVALLHDIKERFGITVLFVTHNLQIAETADRVITIKDGLILNDRLNVHPISAEEMVWG